MKYYNQAWFFLVNILVIQIVPTHSKSPEYSSIAFGDNCSNDSDFCSLKGNEESVETYDYSLSMRTIYQKIPWYLKVPLLPVLFATSPTLPNGECKRQVQKYLEELDNGTLWAVRMFDSSTKYPEGIINGHTRHYGNFDECYQIGIPNEDYLPKSDAEVIGGKYCLVEIEYRRLNASNDYAGPLSLEFDPNGSVWEAIEEKGDFRRVKRYLSELALCVPDACSASDVEKGLDEPLKKIGMEHQIIIKSAIRGKCQTHKDLPVFSIWAKIFCYTILGLLLLVGVSTWYDVTSKHVRNEGNKSLALDLLLCFSAKRNYASITEIKYAHQGLDCIYFFRFVFMCFSVCGHRMLQYVAYPPIDTAQAEYMFAEPFLGLVINGTLIMEIFFTLGGILLCYHMLSELDKKKKMNFVAPIVIRYLRFTPSYFMVIMFITFVLPHLGSGPYWETKIGLESKNCADNWWTNILYINNYVNTDKLCMFQSWYIAVDYHLYIIALFVIYLFWKMPRKFGYPFLIAIITCGSSITFYLTYFYNVPPTCRVLPIVRDMREDPHFIGGYMKTHERLSTYFVGVLGGAIIYDHSLSPWSIPSPWKHLPFIVGSFYIGIQSQFIGAKYYDPNFAPTSMEKALYASLSRLIYAVAMVVIIVYMTVSDKSEFYHKLFKPRWVQPLAKLTYAAYLVHNIHQNYDIGTVRNARTCSVHNAIRDVVVDTVFSFTLAFILAIVIEGPFRKIEKRLILKKSDEHIFANKKGPMLMEKSD